MKKFFFIKFISLAAIALAVSLQSCSSSKPCNCNSLAGDFNYYVTDSLGVRLLEGKVSFDEITKGNYSMSFHIGKEFSDFPGIGGFRSQNPKVTFNETTRKVFITFADMQTDYGLYLELDLVGNSLVGEWTHSTMRGVVNKGRFTGSRTNF